MLRNTKRLANQHKIDAAALDEALQAAHDEHQKNQQFSDDLPHKKDVEKELNKIAKLAVKLNKSINNLHPLILQDLDCQPDGEDSVLSDLSVDLTFLVASAKETTRLWKMPNRSPPARNMAILRITQAWKRLTNKPATYSTARNKKVSDNPDHQPPKYYYGKRYGEFLDFFTEACEIVGLEEGADANVKHFVKLKGKNPDLL